jgi:ribosomal protein S8
MTLKNSFKNLKSSQKQQKKFHAAFSLKAFFRAYVGAINSKALFFNYPFYGAKVIGDFLMCLEKNSRIAGYKTFADDQNIKIFLSYDLTQSKSLVPKIIYYSVRGRRRSASLKNLQQFQTQNPNSLTLIRTSFGVMDIKSCLFHKCGGEFLVSLI